MTLLYEEKGISIPKPTISDMLKNVKYAGDIVTVKRYVVNHLTHAVTVNRGEQQQVLIEDHHEAIVDRDVFQRVQEKRQRRFKGAKFIQYPFGSFLKCPYFGEVLHQRRCLYRDLNSIWICEDNEHCGKFAVLSKDLEQEQQDSSFESQQEYYRNLIARNHEWEYVGIYADRESVTHLENRDQFKKMIDDALNSNLDIILCKSISRWGRNTVDVLRTIKILIGNHVRIIFEQENIDTNQAWYDYDVPDKGIDGYNELIAQYANIERDYEALKEQLSRYNEQRRRYRSLRTELNKRPDKIKEFDAKDWSMFVESVTVGVDGSLTFSLREL